MAHGKTDVAQKMSLVDLASKPTMGCWGGLELHNGSQKPSKPCSSLFPFALFPFQILVSGAHHQALLEGTKR